MVSSSAQSVGGQPLVELFRHCTFPRQPRHEKAHQRAAVSRKRPGRRVDLEAELSTVSSTFDRVPAYMSTEPFSTRRRLSSSPWLPWQCCEAGRKVSFPKSHALPARHVGSLPSPGRHRAPVVSWKAHRGLVAPLLTLTLIAGTAACFAPTLPRLQTDRAACRDGPTSTRPVLHLSLWVDGAPTTCCLLGRDRNTAGV